MKTARILSLQITTEATNLELAIEETICTPSPGLGHGRIANMAALALFAFNFIVPTF